MNDRDDLLGRSALRKEAADWFAAMRGPEAKARRAEFEAWLASDERHRGAYNRIAEAFSLGKRLRDDVTDRFLDPEIRSCSERSGPSRRRLTSVLSIGGLAVAFFAAVWILTVDRPRLTEQPSQMASTSPPGATANTIRLSTAIGEIREFRLADGSTVTLDTDSLVTVDFGDVRRGLRLVHGRARFTVAHEARPFVVAASSGTVTARGTIFDVGFDDDHDISVRLLRGAVDVVLSRRDRNHSAIPVRLRPGQQLRFREHATAPQLAIARPSREDLQWPNGIREFDNRRLGDLLTEANRYSTVPIVAGTPDVGDIRVSGMFRIADTKRLAANLGDLLGLEVVTSPDSIALTRIAPAFPGARAADPGARGGTSSDQMPPRR